MDSGGWIAVLMIGGTAIVCLLAFHRQGGSIGVVPIYRNGSSDAKHVEIDDLRRENQRLRDEVVSLRVDVAALMLANDRLRRRRDGGP